MKRQSFQALMIGLTISIMSLASCVEPPRILVEDQMGVIYPIKRPSWSPKPGDTVIVKVGELMDGSGASAMSIVGNYKGELPLPYKRGKLDVHYIIGTIYE